MMMSPLDQLIEVERDRLPLAASIRGILVTSAIVALTLLMTFKTGNAAGPIKVMTYNIRYLNQHDGDDVWKNRHDKVSETIRGADVVGLQEAVQEQLDEIRRATPGWTWYGVGREDGKTAGEITPIGFRSEQFESVDRGTFWLSTTPDEPGSRGWDAALPRTCTWILLQSKADQSRLLVLNTHFDHRGKTARQKSGQLIAKRVDSMAADDPVIVMGDFNATPDSEPISNVKSGEVASLEDSRDRSTATVTGPTGTWNGFKKIDPDTRIDYLFVNHRVEVIKHSTLDPRTEAGRFASDHLPVMATVEFGDADQAVSGITPTDWPAWRGPEGSGVVPFPGDVPTQWSDNQNVRWRSSIPGRGHGSPTVLGNQVFVPTAVEATQQQLVLSFDRESGTQNWRSIVHEGGFANKSKRQANDKASLASSTIATDGLRLFINFLNDNAVHTTALSLDGDIIWQTKVSDYELHQGYGSSPLVHDSLVIVSADNKAGGCVAGLDRATGQIVWKHQRPQSPNYSSPVIVHIDGRDQLIMTGCDRVVSLNPMTGGVIWSVEGATTECVTSTITDGRLVFSSGGYPRNHIAAYAADDDGKLVWENRLRVYVPSMLQRAGYLYAVLDEGIAMCLRAADGEVQWKERLGGTFTSSPVLVGDRIYATSEDGTTHVFLASEEGFERIGENKLGTSIFATPAISGDAIFMRIATYDDDQRQESLVCIGEQ